MTAGHRAPAARFAERAVAADRRLLGRTAPGRPRLALATAAGFLAAALLAAEAWVLAGVLGAVFLERQALADVLPRLALLLGLVVLRAAAVGSGEVLAQRAASRLKAELRSRLTRHLLALGPAYVHAERTGELVGTTVEGVEALDAYVTEFLPARSLAAVVPIFVLLVVAVVDPWSTLVLLFAGPMLILLLALIGGRARRLTERRFLELGWLGAFFLDMLQGLDTLKLFGRSREQADTIEAISRQHGETTMAVLATAFQTSLVMEWAATAATAMIALEVSVRLMAGALGYQTALAVLLLTPQFFLPLRQLALRYHAGSAGQAAAARLAAILDTPAIAGPAGPALPAEHARPAMAPDPWRLPVGPAGDGRAGVDIAFERVSFAYPAAIDAGEGPRPAALEDLSFDLPAGHTVALVGPTGAGKTTVASLLLGFVAADAGTLRVGGVPIERWDPAAWRRQVAWVPERPHLFHGTVADNLRLARPEAADAELVAAAQAANAHELITALPRGYDTSLGEDGARLSGGERQRLAIARAFLKDAPVLVLDEATAHLDAASEAPVLEALGRLRRGRTVLVIAHRLQLAYDADRIVVLDRGRVVETGDHVELAAAGGLYSRLLGSYAGLG